MRMENYAAQIALGKADISDRERERKKNSKAG